MPSHGLRSAAIGAAFLLAASLSACGSGNRLSGKPTADLTREPKRILIIQTMYGDLTSGLVRGLTACGVTTEVINGYSVSATELRAAVQAKSASFAPDFALEAMALGSTEVSGGWRSAEYAFVLTDLADRKDVWRGHGSISNRGTSNGLADNLIAQMVADKILKSCPAPTKTKAAS